MNFPLFVARRYFLSKRKKNFINLISILSMVCLAFATANLVIVLSVFNGLETLLRSLNTSFDPELKIEPVKGKSFELNDEMLTRLESIPGVKTITQVIEDYAYVRYRNSDIVVTLKGVSDNFLDQGRLEGHISEGELALYRDSIPFALIGRGVRHTLSAQVNDDMAALQIYYIRNFKGSSVDPSKIYSRKSIRPGAVFDIEKNFDENNIFVPLKFARDLMEFGNKRTSLEIKTDGNISSVKKAVQQSLGENFSVLTNEEQHKDLYRLLKVEKLFTFLAFSTLLLVGSINVFFSLMMLAIDKKKDISVLTALGTQPAVIRRIFLTEGIIISFLGAFVGLVAGAVLCFLQDKVGLISMGMENSIVNNYPVEMHVMDFVLIGSVISVVAILLSYRPAILASQSYSIDQL